MQSTGHLFVFEGPDGVGKTTLAEITAKCLNDSGIPCKQFAFPGKLEGSLGHHIYQLHHGDTQFDKSKVSATALQALHIAAHIDAVENLIKPTLMVGTSIILDRYWWSTLVYGSIYGANEATVQKLVDAEIEHWGELRPDHIFLIKRNHSLKNERVDTWNRLAEKYDQVLDDLSDISPAIAIDNSGDSIETAVDQIFPILESALAQTITYHSRNWTTVDAPIQKKQINSDTNTKPPYLNVLLSLAPAVPTEVFRTYWNFAATRQEIFFERYQGSPPPWTNDPILSEFKFTNAYRASDRVSQYLIRHVAYEGEQEIDELFFRILLFKFFNKIQTWELLQENLGTITYSDYSYSVYDKIITDAMSRGERVFSGAYIMPSGTSSFGEARKHRNYLKLLEKMMREDVPLQVNESQRMRDVFELLLSYPCIGEFLAYQLVTDLNYSCLTDFSEMEFVMPGPGARSGIRKCFSSTGGLNDADIIRFVTESQEKYFREFDIEFKSLWGRKLQLIDCQNLFCEVDKYARIAHPTVAGIGNRTRIKQKFKDPGSRPQVQYWYPPKWGINDRITQGANCE